jgi:hypothetical protein
MPEKIGVKAVTVSPLSKKIKTIKIMAGYQLGLKREHSQFFVNPV